MSTASEENYSDGSDVVSQKRLLEFMEAVVLDDKSKVEAILESDPKLDVNEIVEEYETTVLCEARSKDVAQLLIDFGAETNDRSGRTHRSALHCASQLGRKDVCEVLLAANAQVDIRDEYGFTPLMLHCFTGNCNNSEMVRLFVRFGADVNATNDGGFSALHYAAYDGMKDVCDILCDAGANVNYQDSDGNTPLHMCVKAGELEAAKCLVKHKAKAHIGNNKKELPLDLLEKKSGYVDDDPTYEEFKTLLEDTFNKRHNKIKSAAHRTEAVENASMSAQSSSLQLGLESFHEAVRRDNFSKAESLLKQGGFDINAKSGLRGYTALHYASSSEVAQLLLDHGADPTIRDEMTGETPLHAAVDRLDLDVCKVLVSANADLVNLSTFSGFTPLMEASLPNGEQKRIAIAQLLIANGADVNATNNHRKSTALHRAASSGVTNLCKVLLEFGANPNAQNVAGDTPLHHCAEHGALEVARLLVKFHAKTHIVNDNNELPVDLLVECHDTHDEFKAFLEETIKKRHNKIKSAAHRTESRNVSEEKFEELHMSVREDEDCEKVKALLEAGDFDINALHRWYNSTVLHEARSKDVAETLIDHGALHTVRTLDNKTPLHYAAQCGRIDVCQALLDAGADCNVRSQREETPLLLHCYAGAGNIELVKLLLSHGADVNAANITRSTPLESAAFYARNDVCKVLLEAGANVNFQDDQGNTPLHVCAENGHFETAQLLVKCNAKSHIENNYKQLPIDTLKMHHECYHEFKKLLQDTFKRRHDKVKPATQ